MDNSKYSFVHLDTDTYESTIRGLEYFSTRMSIGGSIVIHDYYNSQCPGVSVAVDKFMNEQTGEYMLELFKLEEHSHTNITQAIITRV